MELRQLHTFRTVAKSLSFTRAAETLSYAQSSVSAQIQELEEELNVVLFERLGRKIMLTEGGQRLLQYADKILGLVEEARNAVTVGEEPVGLLTITAPESVCTYRLPLVLDRLRRQCPRLDLIFQPLGTREDWERQLTAGAADAALVMIEPRHTPNLVLEPLATERIFIVAHPEHRLANAANVDITDFRAETMLLTESGCSYRARFERMLQAGGVRPATVLEFHSVEAIKQCTLGGLGLAVLPEIAVRAEVAEGRLTILPFPTQPFELVTFLAWHKDKWISPALAAFIQVTRDLLGR